MPLLDLNEDRDLRPSSVVLGHIRLGVVKGNRPQQSDSFIFTSSDPLRLRPLVQDYGGEVEEYAPLGAGTERWRLISTADAITALFPFPTAEQNAPQHWELWSAGGIQRRCDGFTCTQFDIDEVSGEVTEILEPCICKAADKRECKPTSRLMLWLPQTGFGIWQLQTQSIRAARRLYDQVGFIAEQIPDALNRVPIRVTYTPEKNSYYDPKKRERLKGTKRFLNVFIAEDVAGALRALGQTPQVALVSAIESTLQASGRSLGAGPSAPALGPGSNEPSGGADERPGDGEFPSPPPSGDPAPPDEPPAGVPDGEGRPPAAKPWEAYLSALNECTFVHGSKVVNPIVGKFWRERKLGPPKDSWPVEQLRELTQLLEDKAAQQSLESA